MHGNPYGLDPVDGAASLAARRDHAGDVVVYYDLVAAADPAAARR